MKGFICDICGKIQEGEPNDELPSVNMPEIHQYAHLDVEFSRLPTPDICTECKIDIAERVVKEAKAKREK